MSVLLDHIDQALDRFANVFVKPLLRADSFHREIKAVDSEFQAAIQRDAERCQQVFSKYCTGCYANFLWGDERSLRPQTNEDNTHDNSSSTEVLLRIFHDKFYSSDIMNLVIVAAESKMLELKKQVEMLFSKIKNKNLSGKSLILRDHEVSMTGEHPSNERITQNLAYARAESAGSVKMTIVESVRQQTNLLKLVFQLPSLQSQYTSKPSSYIASLLGHESKGSLLEELKRQGLGTEISCGCSFDGFSRSSISYIFEVSINLTEKGLVEYSGVIELLF